MPTQMKRTSEVNIALDQLERKTGSIQDCAGRVETQILEYHCKIDATRQCLKELCKTIEGKR